MDVETANLTDSGTALRMIVTCWRCGGRVHCTPFFNANAAADALEWCTKEAGVEALFRQLALSTREAAS